MSKPKFKVGEKIIDKKETVWIVEDIKINRQHQAYGGDIKYEYQLLDTGDNLSVELPCAVVDHFEHYMGEGYKPEEQETIIVDDKNSAEAEISKILGHRVLTKFDGKEYIFNNGILYFFELAIDLSLDSFKEVLKKHKEEITLIAFDNCLVDTPFSLQVMRIENKRIPVTVTHNCYVRMMAGGTYHLNAFFMQAHHTQKLQEIAASQADPMQKAVAMGVVMINMHAEIQREMSRPTGNFTFEPMPEQKAIAKATNPKQGNHQSYNWPNKQKIKKQFPFIKKQYLRR